jgi:hypothetical protein
MRNANCFPNIILSCTCDVGGSQFELTECFVKTTMTIQKGNSQTLTHNTTQSKLNTLTGRPPLISKVHLVFLLRQCRQARYALIGSGGGALTRAPGSVERLTEACSPEVAIDGTPPPDAIVALCSSTDIELSTYALSNSRSRYINLQSPGAT